MPRLVIIAPCVDYILGQDGSLSLIKIVDQITVDAEAAVVSDAAQFSAPLHVITSWAREHADLDRFFEQRLRILSPSGGVSIEKVVRFHFASEATGHYTVARIDGFPVQEQGAFEINVSIRAADEDAEWLYCNSHPFRVSHRVSRELQSS